MGRPGNLCDSLIVVGCVDGRATRLVDTPHGQTVRTDVQFGVARVVQGPARAGEVLALTVEGGEAEGISVTGGHGPVLEQDACYSLFFLARDDGTRAYQRDLLLPARLEGVPEEGVLRRVWQATCAACGGELYVDDPTWHLTVPGGVARDGLVAVFRPPRAEIEAAPWAFAAVGLVGVVLAGVLLVAMRAGRWRRPP